MTTSARRKKVFVHIGFHKTGTTAIQSYASRNSDLLHARGLLYPAASRPVNNAASHSLYPLLVLHDHGVVVPPWFRVRANLARRSGGVLRELATEISTSAVDKVLISSEEFVRFAEVGQPESAVASLVANLEPHEVHVVCYLREPLAFWESWYNQHIKNLSPAHRFSRFWLNLHATYTSYAMVLDQWMRTVGMDRVHLVEYGLQGDEHLRSFFALLGVDLTSDEIRAGTPSGDPNPRVQRDALEVLRVRNHVIAGRTPAEFLATFDSPEASVRLRPRLAKRCADVIEDLERLARDYSFPAAEAWKPTADDLLTVEESLNRMATPRDADVAMKLQLYSAEALWRRTAPAATSGRGWLQRLLSHASRLR